MNNCTNYCNISGNYLCLSGGVLGSAASDEMYIENCENLGKISASYGSPLGGSSASAVTEVGGVIGEFSAMVQGEMRNCVNRGTLTIRFLEGENVQPCYQVGGVVGFGMDVKIIECTNYGDIIEENGNEINYVNYYAADSIGGILGEGEITVANCVNYGDISCPNHDAVGGIAGLGNGSRSGGTSIEKCYNIGKIIGRDNVGGITGSLRLVGETGFVKNSYNIGAVTGNQNVGGIVGENGRSGQQKGVIKNSYNIGKITGNTNIGGIAGITHTETNSTIENSYYLLNSAEVAYNTDTGNTSIAEVKTEEEMKQEAFVELLNQNNEEKVWIKDDENDGYPKLSFETSN